MKPKLKLIIASFVALFAAASHAAPLIITSVGAPAINCVFATNCTADVTDTSSPIVLSNSTGIGSLQTRTFLGQTGSVAAGLYAYLYRIDLTSVTANSNSLPCLTNEVNCMTNVAITVTNALVCQTNQVPASNRLMCVTNTIPGTNLVFFFTNAIPATNFVRCTTNLTGETFCITNAFPGTNFVTAFTNRFPSSNIVSCSTVIVPGTNIVKCVTKRLSVTNSTVTCSTNLVSCPGTAPCIDTLRLRFGTPAPLDFAGGGSTSQVFVVASGSEGSIAPTSVESSNGIVTIRFANGVCPGESSYYIGLISSRRPASNSVVLELTSGSNLVATARTPRDRTAPIECDFAPLRTALLQLPLSDILAPNNNAREGRRGSLLNSVEAAVKDAQKGVLLDVLDALDKIARKTGSDRNSWVREPSAGVIRGILDTLLDCLEPYAHDGDRDHDDEHNDDHDGRKSDHSKK